MLSYSEAQLYGIWSSFGSIPVSTYWLTRMGRNK
jgi:hypothetical protein